MGTIDQFLGRGGCSSRLPALRDLAFPCEATGTLFYARRSSLYLSAIVDDVRTALII